MPLPATRHPVPDVGGARDQGSGVAPCAHPQVGRLLWCRQPRQRQVRPVPVRYVRCADFRGFLEEIATASCTRQAHGRCAGQRQIPPCLTVTSFAQKIPEGTDLALSATIQSAVGSRRTGLEVGSAHGYTQPFLCRIERRAHRSRNLFRPLAKTKLNIV